MRGVKSIIKKGLRFNKLIAIKYSKFKNSSNRHLYWTFKCDCGKVKDIIASHVIDGNIKSCGCHKIYMSGNVHRKHGMYRSPIYRVWAQMLSRCNDKNNKNYSNYGGRGIKVCNRWKDFEVFYKDIGAGYVKGLSIERINVNIGYSPENCKLIKISNQADNRRNTRNFTHNGETMNIAKWAKSVNMNIATLRYRLIIMKWSLEDAINKRGKIRRQLIK